MSTYEDDFGARFEVIKASESPTLAAQKERGLANRKRQLKSAIARGYAPPEAMEELEAEVARAQERKEERERIDAEARRQLDAEYEEQQVERAKQRLRGQAEALPEGRRRVA